MVISYVVPVVQMVVTFAIFTLWMKQPLTASVVFSALQGFHLIRTAFLILVFYTSALIRANVSLGRIQDFLNHTELLDRYTNDPGYGGVSAEREEHLGLGHATFSWTKNLHDPKRTFQLSIDEDIHFKQGALNLIVGPTGCGKTSLIMALLGEMHYIPMGPNSWVNMPARNGVAYCAQESWIRSLSVKDNILFGAPFDEARYHKVVHQCGLERDFSLFESGDATEIGEKGLNLRSAIRSKSHN
jgi:ABC-type multidrug transport system fused ATPase/permease subunit